MYREINTNDFKIKYLNQKENLELIDVREEFEFNKLRVKGSKLISLSELESKLSEINWNKEVIFICRSGSRSWYVTNVLNSKWYSSQNLAWWIEILKLNCEECIKNWDININYFENH